MGGVDYRRNPCVGQFARGDLGKQVQVHGQLEQQFPNEDGLKPDGQFDHEGILVVPEVCLEIRFCRGKIVRQEGNCIDQHRREQVDEQKEAKEGLYIYHFH